MNRRALLVGLGIAVVAAVIALAVSAQQSSHAQLDPERGEPASQGAPGVSAPPASSRPRAAAREVRADADRAADNGTLVRQDGTEVRDHRSQGNAAPDLSASPATRLAHARVAPEVITAFRLKLRPIVKRCAADYAGDLAEGAQLRVTVDVAITSEVVTVAGMDVATKDVKDTSLATCVTEGGRTLELPAAGHEDVSHHKLTFPFRLPVE